MERRLVGHGRCTGERAVSQGIRIAPKDAAERDAQGPRTKKQVKFRLHPTDAARLAKAARKAGLTVQDYLERALFSFWDSIR